MTNRGKVWVDIDKVVKASSVSDNLKGYDKVMREIPKHSKDNTKVIYRRKEYIILKARDNFIVVNTKSKMEFKHTHTNNFNYAKSLIDLCVRNKIPQKPNKRTVESLQRLSMDKSYLKKLEGLK